MFDQKKDYTVISNKRIITENSTHATYALCWVFLAASKNQNMKVS